MFISLQINTESWQRDKAGLNVIGHVSMQMDNPWRFPTVLCGCSSS